MYNKMIKQKILIFLASARFSAAVDTINKIKQSRMWRDLSESNEAGLTDQNGDKKMNDEYDLSLIFCDAEVVPSVQIKPLPVTKKKHLKRTCRNRSLKCRICHCCKNKHRYGSPLKETKNMTNNCG